jgi:uncharacterized Ntn-hydrolase superfamily protein
MNWSIVARDSNTGKLGIAVATCFFAVGALVPYVAAETGAIASQGLVNPYSGIDRLRMLREGAAPDQLVKALVAADSGRTFRQMHVIDQYGRIAAYTAMNACRITVASLVINSA